MDNTGSEGGGESFSDIQSYLANFNKEISSNNSQNFILTPGASGDQLYTDGNSSAAQGEDSGAEEAQDGTSGDGESKLDQPLMTPSVPNLTEDEPPPPVTIEPEDNSQAQLYLQQPPDSAVEVLASVAANTIPQPQVLSSAATSMVDNSMSEQQLVTVQSGPDGGQTRLVAVRPDQGQLVTVMPDGQMSLPDGQQIITQPPNLQPTPMPAQIHSSPPQTTLTPALQSTDQSGLAMPQAPGGANYQTVTIVPSDVNQGGEVSYVLIVSQGDETKQENVDMSVYDFKEEAKIFDEQADEDAPMEQTTPRKIIRHHPIQRKTPASVHTQLMCNYCNYTSPKRYLLTRHMKTHSEERPHKCHICDRGFKTVPSLQNHINTHTGVRPHKCKECDSAFTTSGELVRHVRYRHTFEKPHKCTECDYSSVELSKLKRHMRSHTGERPYQCPHCSYASPDTYKLKRHLRIHTGERPYECDICHTRFTQSNSLKAHKLIHSGNKPVFQCELCPTTCGRKTDLKIHVQKLHTSDKPLQCKKCGKSFPDRYTYKIHLKTHDGEKCFKCELCPYAALSQRHLESHILTHTGEKPFHCNICGQTFRQKQLLRRHHNLYHTPDYIAPEPKEKPHHCVECNKGFTHRGNLLRHMAIHDPNNPEYQAMLQQEMTMEEMEEHDADMQENSLDSGTEMYEESGGQQVGQLQQVCVELGITLWELFLHSTVWRLWLDSARKLSSTQNVVCCVFDQTWRSAPTESSGLGLLEQCCACSCLTNVKIAVTLKMKLWLALNCDLFCNLL